MCWEVGTDIAFPQIRITDPSQYRVENSWFFFSEGLVVTAEERRQEEEACY